MATAACRRVCSTIGAQRVFGDSGTDNLSSDAGEALVRLGSLAAFVTSPSWTPNTPWLHRHFEALQQHLAGLVDQASREGGIPRFSANLDELSWTVEEPEHFIDDCRLDCDDLAQDLQQAMAERNVKAVVELLELPAWKRGAYGWEGWAYAFGFSGLHHPYFSWRTEARDISFAEFLRSTADREEAELVEKLTHRFESGDLDAAYLLALEYRDGETIGPNDELARAWMARAAGLVDAPLSNSLPLLPHPSSIGDTHSSHVDMGQPPPGPREPAPFRAMLALACMYFNGTGGPIDKVAGRQWLLEASECGGADDSEVMDWLGCVLCEGIGGATDTRRGLESYLRAGELGSHIAWFQLGRLHEGCMGVARDLEAAKEFYRRSEELGNLAAPDRLTELD